MKRGYRDRDYIITHEQLIFTVVGNLHPRERVISYLKYTPSKVKWQTYNHKGFTRALKSYTTSDLLRTLRFLEDHYPQYVFHDDIIGGLRDTSWPGRMHIISDNPLIILDGAHNPRAIRGLAGSVSNEFSPKNIILVLGIMEDKDISRIIGGIIDVTDYVICAKPVYYRSADPGILMRYVSSRGKKGEAVQSISGAIRRAKSLAGPRDMILVTGSLFTVGEALTYFDPVKYRPDGF